MPGPVAPFPCPQCGGKCWDNRNDPTRKQTQPLVKCKNKDGCGWAVWDAAKLPAGVSAPADPRTQAAGPAPSRTSHMVLDRFLKAAILAVRAVDMEICKDDQSQARMTEEIEQKHVTTLFLARIDGKGIFAAEKAALIEREKKAREAAAEAKRAAAEAEQRRLEQERARQASESQVGAHASGDWPPLAGQDGDQDDDLPF